MRRTLPLLFALACLGSSAFLSWRQSRDPIPALGEDAISIYLDRLRGVRSVLGDVKDVGFLSDKDMGVESPSAGILPDLHLTQLVLLPVLITPDPSSGLFVGNFFQPEAVRRVLEDPRFVLVRDLGKQVLVLRRRG